LDTRAAVTLSTDTLQPPTARELYFSPPADRATQEIRELTFFRSLRLRNGTYKDAYAHRLDDLNELVSVYLPVDRPLRIMDVAISSGIGTLEWSDDLRRRAVEHEMIGGDLTLNAYLVSLGRHLHALVDSDGYPLQFDVQGRPLPNPMGPRPRIRHLFSLWQIERTVRARFSTLRAACIRGGGHWRDQKRRLSCRQIALLSPRLTPTCGVVTVEDDIFAGDGGGPRFQVLRAANILNRAYFGDQQLTRALRNLRSRLRPEGILIICRTSEDGTNNATVFRLQSNRQFRPVGRLNNGSEVEDLVLALSV
jgi:hypothetical protein